MREAPRLPRRPRARRVGGGAHPRRRPRAARQPRVAHREAVPDRTRPVVVYCAGGSRSAFAAKTLEELGYADVVSLAGGFTDWKRNGFPTRAPARSRRRQARALQPPPADPRGRRGGAAEAARLARAPDRRRRARLPRLALPRRGGRRARSGSSTPTSSTTSNLQRQIVHSTETPRRAEGGVGEADARGAQPGRRRSCRTRSASTSENIDRILADGWDVIVDGADNFPTRYLVNDASVWHGIPVVHGSIYPLRGPGHRLQARTRGRATAASSRSRRRPSSRRAAPRAAFSACCPGIIGSLQANEALKLLLGIGEPLVGRLLLFDALGDTFTRSSSAARPRLPGLRRAPDDHRVHRLRRVLLPGPATRGVVT